MSGNGMNVLNGAIHKDSIRLGIQVVTVLFSLLVAVWYLRGEVAGVAQQVRVNQVSTEAKIEALNYKVDALTGTMRAMRSRLRENERRQFRGIE